MNDLYLLEEGNPEVDDMNSNITRLLESDIVENTLLAFQMIEGGGLAKSVRERIEATYHIARHMIKSYKVSAVSELSIRILLENPYMRFYRKPVFYITVRVSCLKNKAMLFAKSDCGAFKGVYPNLVSLQSALVDILLHSTVCQVAILVPDKLSRMYLGNFGLFTSCTLPEVSLSNALEKNIHMEMRIKAVSKGVFEKMNRYEIWEQ